MAGDERNFPSRNARYSSPRLSMGRTSPLARRRFPSGGVVGGSSGFSGGMSTWSDSAVQSAEGSASLSPLVAPAYSSLQAFQQPVGPMQMQLQRSGTSTSCDESSSDTPEGLPQGVQTRSASAAKPKAQQAPGRGAQHKPPSKRRRKESTERKERKPTHTLRKEQKQELLAQVAQMQTQLDSLKAQAIVTNALHVKKRTQAPVMNAILRDAVQSRQTALADVQGLLSGYVQKQHDISPINTCIQLEAAPQERHKALVEMKDHKLRLTREFLLRRSQGLDPGKLYCEEARFETAEGDYCSLRFSVSHFRGVSSVRAVFDAALFHIANVEISMSEVLGNITIREDDDSGTDNTRQLRLVTSIGKSSQVPAMEMNTVQFSDFHEAATSSAGAGEGEYGVILGDFVDEDELYPYRPLERLRKDVTAALLVTRLPPPEGQTRSHYHRSSAQAKGGAEDQLVVKVTIWALIKLHHSDLEVPDECLEEARHESGRWAEEMLRAMRRTVAMKHPQR